LGLRGPGRTDMAKAWAACIGVAILILSGPVFAQESSPEAATVEAEQAAIPAAQKPKQKACTPGIGCVTNLPLPRFVSLKTDKGNARRGPGLTHRIDWVFTRAGMPLKITAEHENWRRIEDSEGAGGWVHYSLLSGTRSVLVATDMAEFRTRPDVEANVSLQAEAGAIGRVLECATDWCRIGFSEGKGWVQKDRLWGVLPGEVIE
jgi:SH3-like domain-containing protein